MSFSSEEPLDFSDPEVQKLALHRCVLCENPHLHGEPLFSIRGCYVNSLDLGEHGFVCSSCNLIYVGWFQPMVYVGDFDARDPDAVIRQLLFMKRMGQL